MNVFRCVLVLTAGLHCAVIAAQQSRSNLVPRDSESGSIYITHVTVIDTQIGRESGDQTVVILGDRISEVRDSEGVKPPVGAKAVDATGKYLIPGLWDMHVHGTRFDGALPLYIANGVTGVREMVGRPDANKFRADLAAKHLITPGNHHIPVICGFSPSFTQGFSRSFTHPPDFALVF